jgi:serine/threonine protein phosphatase PrpC
MSRPLLPSPESISSSIHSISLDAVMAIAAQHPIHAWCALGLLLVMVWVIIRPKSQQARQPQAEPQPQLPQLQLLQPQVQLVMTSDAKELTKCGRVDAKLGAMIAENRKLQAMPALPVLSFDEDELESTGSLTDMNVNAPLPAIPMLFDDHAHIEEPTHTASFAIRAAGGTDCGQLRKYNEDSFLVNPLQNLFIIADGMGGHRGGALASELAVRTIGDAFAADQFDGPAKSALPTHATKLARAIQMANHAIRGVAHAHREFAEMGTTIVAALFAPQKKRLYIGHVGDSRCYRLRRGELQQMTQDHTMATLGVKGPTASQLARAVGPIKLVPADIVVAEPEIGDLYLLCSDGVSKMLSDDSIRSVLVSEPDVDTAVATLIRFANESGGGDNITAVLIQVRPPTWTTPSTAYTSIAEHRA